MKRAIFAAVVLASSWSMAKAADVSTVSLVEKAELEYGNLQFERSLTLLDTALANQGNNRSDLVRIYLLRGLCEASLKGYQEAKYSFSVLLALDPSYRIGSDIAPRIREPFEQVLRDGVPRLDIGLLPPAVAVTGKPIVFVVQVREDTLRLFQEVRLWFRDEDGRGYSKVSSKIDGEGEIRLIIPQNLLPEVGAGTKQGAGRTISWYSEVMGRNGSYLKKLGDELHPLALFVIERKDSVVSVLKPAESSWYEKWWVWTIVGGVVAAGVTTAVVLAPSGDSGDIHEFTVGIGVRP